MRMLAIIYIVIYSTPPVTEYNQNNIIMLQLLSNVMLFLWFFADLTTFLQAWKGLVHIMLLAAMTVG